MPTHRLVPSEEPSHVDQGLLADGEHGAEDRDDTVSVSESEAAPNPESAAAKGPKVREHLECPEETHPFHPNRITYSWVTELLKDGYKTPLELENLWKMPSYMTATHVCTSISA